MEAGIIGILQKLASEYGLSIAILASVVVYLVKVGRAQIDGIKDAVLGLQEAIRELRESNRELISKSDNVGNSITMGGDAIRALRDEVLKNREDILENRNVIRGLTKNLELIKKIDSQELEMGFSKLETKIDKFLESKE